MLLLVLHVVSVLFLGLFPHVPVGGVGPLSKKWTWSGGGLLPWTTKYRPTPLHRATCINQRVIQETPQACSCPHSDCTFYLSGTKGLDLDGEMRSIPDKILRLPDCSSCFHPPRPSLACWRGTRSHLQQRTEGFGVNPLHCQMPGNVKQVQVHLGISAAPLAPCYNKI